MNRRLSVFVLGGPGSGKGTQCSFIQARFGFPHLSAGQLLRDQIIPSASPSPLAHTIQTIINTGKIVPSSITIALLEAAMDRLKQHQLFLIDGFPRNLQNLHSWEATAGKRVGCPFVLHLSLSEPQMVSRLQGRASSENRSDDNMEVIMKRFQTYKTETAAVLKELEGKGLVRNIDGSGTPEQIFERIAPLFEQFKK